MVFSATTLLLQRQITNNKNVISSSIKSFLQKEQSTLRQGPIIVISSSGKNNNKNDDLLLKQVEFYGKQAMGYQMINFTTSPASYPLLHEETKKLQLLQQRTGGSSTMIMGVGTGVAIDLAKHFVSGNNDNDCFLIPGTDAAVLASYTPFSMLLDTQEETIVTTTSAATKDTNATIVLDPNHIHSHPHTKSACQSILMDSGVSTSQNILESLLQQDQKEDGSNNLNWLQQTAPYLQDGTGQQQQRRRSIPLALSCSLMPPVFASTHVLTFWAALLNHYTNNDTTTSLKEENVPTLASLALEAHTVSKLMKYIHSNQAAQPNNVMDATDDELEMVLSTSLNR